MNTTLSFVALKELVVAPTLIALNVNLVAETYVNEPAVEVIAELNAVRKSSKTNASRIVFALSAV